MNTLKFIDRFKTDMQLQRLAANTIETYLAHVELFLNSFPDKAEPKAINEADIKTFLLTKCTTANYQRSMHSAIKKFYELVCHQPNKVKYIPYAKPGKYLPVVLTQSECAALLAVCQNPKHLCIIMLLYGCGLRVSEVINLKISDIDSAAMVIHIRHAKGNKDRDVMLDQNLLQHLRQYYTTYKPNVYLFNGQYEPTYSERSINTFLKKYAALAGITKPISAHTLRHCFATHLMEHNINERMIQQLMGHINIKTTMRYQHISNNRIANTPSPLKLLHAS